MYKNKIDNALKIILSNTYLHEYLSLDFDKLKKEYRKKAMLLHPDRVKITGTNEAYASEKIKILNNAYNTISNLFKTKKYISIPYIKPYYKQHIKKYYSNNSGFYSHNKKTKIVPKYKLRLCRFLYYKGLINYKTIINAIIWQLRNRPKVGDIALKEKYVTFEKILEIIKNRKIGEKFCETAVRLNFLQEQQVKHIFSIQRSYNKPIGQYFLEKKILTRQELNSTLLELKHHNSYHS